MNVSNRVLKALIGREFYGVGLKDIYWSIWNTVTSRYQFGENVYERDWDVLVVLDTCRIDAIQQVASEYDFITGIDRLLSVGSASPEWVMKTFTEDYVDDIAETVFVTGNVWAHRILNEKIHEEDVESDYSDSSYEYLDSDGIANWRTVDSRAFTHLDHVWQLTLEQTGRIHPVSHGAPGVVTDRAVALAREHSPDRLIVWYSLPHSPYVANAVDDQRELHDYEADPFSALKNGESMDVVYESYLDNLRLVLDHVSVLLQNVDADTVAISADHGEAFGEYGFYNHKFGVPHPKMKYVPWIETTATDSGEYVPKHPEPDLNDVDRQDTEELLRSMGYLK